MKWEYIGYEHEKVKSSETSKKTPEQIKEEIENMPMVEGEVYAVNVDSLVRVLISNGITPIKIKPITIKRYKDIKRNNTKSKKKFIVYVVLCVFIVMSLFSLIHHLIL